MKKNMNTFLGKILQASFAVTVFLSFAFVLHAQTWTTPTGSPPTGNVAAPINVGGTTQFKTGAFGIGESSSTTVGTSTGFSMEVNGPVSADGFASFGETDLTQFTHMGSVDVASSPYSGATKFDASNSIVTAMVNDSQNSNFAFKENNLKLAGFFGKVGSTFAKIFSPNTALAVGGIGGSTLNTPPTPTDDYGPCFGNFCTSTQYCNLNTASCASTGTLHTGSGLVSGSVSGQDIPQATDALPTANLTASALSISVGGSSTLTWTVSAVRTCRIVSSNVNSNWSSIVVSDSNLDQPHTFSGTHSITFAKPGVYTYTIRCTTLPHGSINYGTYPVIYTQDSNIPDDYISYVSDSATITVGDPYTLQVNGNLNADGNIYTRGNFIEQGRHVCLQDGTDCPAPLAHIVSDSSGNINFYLPYTSGSPTTLVSGGTTSNFVPVMYVNSSGIHLATGTHIYVGSTMVTVP